MLILDKDKDQGQKDGNKDDGHLESKEDHIGPELEKNDQFELNWESWVRHGLIKNLLTPNGLILVLHLFQPLIPTAKEVVYPHHDHLNDHKIESLVADQLQSLGFLLIHCVVKVESWNYDVVQKVEGYSGQNYKHSSMSLSIWMPHF